MFFSEKITLRVVEGTISGGYATPSVKSSVEVWCDIKSLARSEFYSAMSAGQKCDIAFGVHAEDFSGQNSVLYNGEEYAIVRTYEKGLGVIELVCQRQERL